MFRLFNVIHQNYATGLFFRLNQAFLHKYSFLDSVKQRRLKIDHKYCTGETVFREHKQKLQNGKQEPQIIQQNILKNQTLEKYN